MTFQSSGLSFYGFFLIFFAINKLFYRWNSGMCFNILFKVFSVTAFFKIKIDSRLVSYYLKNYSLSVI